MTGIRTGAVFVSSVSTISANNNNKRNRSRNIRASTHDKVISKWDTYRSQFQKFMNTLRSEQHYMDVHEQQLSHHHHGTSNNNNTIINYKRFIFKMIIVLKMMIILKTRLARYSTSNT